MTKYVLNSGQVTRYADKAQKFFTEVLKGVPQECCFLVCLFVMVREDWDLKFSDLRERYPNFFPADVKVAFELAYPQTFVQQIQKADVVYICGGDDHLLLYWLRQFDIPKIWEDKVVAGSSAGFDALTRHFMAVDWRYCMDGLGVLPVKVIPHYGSDYGSNDLRGSMNWQESYKELSQFGDLALPIVALPEGEYSVFNI